MSCNNPALRPIFSVPKSASCENCSEADLQLSWKASGENEFSCALYGRIISLRQDNAYMHYRSIFPSTLRLPPTPPPSSATDEYAGVHKDDTLDLLRHYLNLSPNLSDLYGQWSSADQNFKRKAPKFTGVRILRQHAWEALICFICSSNNNIARITQMVPILLSSLQVAK